jgi:hypothetical protein
MTRSHRREGGIDSALRFFARPSASGTTTVTDVSPFYRCSTLVRRRGHRVPPTLVGRTGLHVPIDIVVELEMVRQGQQNRSSLPKGRLGLLAGRPISLLMNNMVPQRVDFGGLQRHQERH